MADASLLSKFLSTLKPKAPEKGAGSPYHSHPGMEKLAYPEAVFAQKFVSSGGRFIFCEDRESIISALRNIFEEEDICVLSCNDPQLQSLAHTAGALSLTELSKKADAAFITCELLIAHNGGIMVTANQTYHNKILSLPNTIIVFGTVSQIIDKLNNALTYIKAKYPPKEIPSMITTIKGPKGDGLEDPNSAFSTKNLYLLLTV
ncbi:MAG: LUD domain-containing protein [Thermaurantimonas sp.]